MERDWYKMFGADADTILNSDIHALANVFA